MAGGFLAIVAAVARLTLVPFGLVHLRDQKSDGTWSEAMGKGGMDYMAVGKALKKINFAGDAVIELAHEGGFELTRPLRESLKISRRYVKETLGY